MKLQSMWGRSTPSLLSTLVRLHPCPLLLRTIHCPSQVCWVTVVVVMTTVAVITMLVAGDFERLSYFPAYCILVLFLSPALVSCSS